MNLTDEGIYAAREDSRRRAQGRCCDCGGELPADLQGNPNPTSCHECAAAYVGAAHREMDTIRSSVNYSKLKSVDSSTCQPVSCAAYNTARTIVTSCRLFKPLPDGSATNR